MTMAEEQQGLLDGPGAFDEPYDPSKAFDRSQEVDLGAIAVEWTKEQALRERQAQDEAEAMSLCQGIDEVILPHLKEEHTIPGVTVGNRISKLTNDDWATFNRLRTFCLEYGANVDCSRWPISPQGCVAFLTEESKHADADHLRKIRNSISRVHRALLDPTEEPIVRAALARLCERDDDKPQSDEKE
jgi:hypothetical protein